MNSLVMRAAILTLLIPTGRTPAQADRVFLRPESGGPMGVLTAAAFSPDGKRLYAAGLDKVVRVWTLEQNQFRPGRTAYRVPVGPGFSGAINAIAVSPDGQWLAVGGVGVITGRGDVRTVGMVFPSSGKTQEQLEDEGTIFVFNTTNERDVRTLRGHSGPIRALTFVSGRDRVPQLVSVAEDPMARGGARAGGQLRLWDVSTKKSAAEQALDVANPTLPLGLTAWQTDQGPRGATVAVAWGDGKLRIWAPSAATNTPENDGQFNSAISRATPDGGFWTSSFDRASNSGVMTRWQRGPAGSSAPVAADKITWRPDDAQRGPFIIPREIATFPSRPGGPLDRAAVIARRQSARAAPDDQDVLFLVDLERKQVLGSPKRLGPFVTNLRRLAVSPTGRHVAIADADNQRLLMFTATELVEKGDRAEPMVLRGVGANFAKSGFRKKGDSAGLALENTAGERLVFDFAGRQLTPEDASWQPDRPDISDWTVTPTVKDGRLTVTVAGPGQPEKRITIAERGRAITETALLPPRAPFAAGPQLIVGWLDDRSQPALGVFDVGQGVLVRQLTGHLAAVRSLSISADGRLLASAADDQTVCVWSLRSLDQTIGKIGSLPGLRLKTANNRPMVAEAPAGSNLPVGAVVESITLNGQTRAPASAIELYTAIWYAKPGAEATLRVAPQGAAARDVRMTVAQGTDERKPLLSLFVTRDGPVNRRNWIAWTSMGPYDSSSPQAEEHLGWHFNPDKMRDGEPVSFARADKYRDSFQKRGILEHVIRRANTLDALKDYEAKPPIMGVMLDGIDPAAPLIIDRPLARDRLVTARISVEAPFPLERINEARWRLDDGPWQSLAEPTNRTWSAELSKSQWGRGPHRVQAEIVTDGRTRRYQSQALFHFAPAAPQVTFDPAWIKAQNLTADGPVLRGETKSAQFSLSANVEPGSPDERPKVEIRHNGELVPVAALPIRMTLPLREGDNLIEIRATNAGASDDLRQWESDVRTLRVHYARVTAPPRIALQIRSAGNGRDVRKPGADRKVIVHNRGVRVFGTVSTDEAEPTIERNGRAIAVNRAAEPNRYTFEQSIDLDRPGETALTYSAQTRRSPKSDERLVVVYQPELPFMGAMEPAEPDVHASTFDLKLDLQPAGHEHPCTAEVLVNGDRQHVQIVPSASRQIRFPIRLRPHANSVVIRLHNEWGASDARSTEYRYLRPPVLEELTSPPTAADSTIDASAVVQSPAELPPTSATINGRVFDRDQFTARNQGGDRWSVTITGIHLDEGDNNLNATVANEDGDSVLPRTLRVRYDKPLPPKPEVQFTGIATGEAINVLTQDRKLLINVRSKSPLQRIEVRTSDGQVAFLRTSGAAPLEDEAVVVRVPYGGRMTATLSAVNAGGESTATISLQRPQLAAYVVIDALADVRTGESLPAAAREADKPLVFESAKDGRLKISGRVFFDPADPRNRAPATVRVRANAFQQIPVETTPSPERSNEYRFSATVLLTRANDNEIIVDLPDLPKADGRGDACIVRRCANPSIGRRLHLVVVGIDARDGEVLQKTALNAIGAEEINPGSTSRSKWRALPIFEDVQSYAPLVGDVEKSQIIKRLQDVARQIRIRAESREAALSDVVLLCYQGKEVINDRGHFLWTSDSRPTNVHLRGLSCGEIIREFDRTGGAQVLLLDVERLDSSPRPAAQTFSSTRLGVFHAAWSGSRAPTHGLLALLERSWPKANRLGPLAEQVGAMQQTLEPQMQFYPHIVGQLALLEFGGLSESRR